MIPLICGINGILTHHRYWQGNSNATKRAAGICVILTVNMTTITKVYPRITIRGGICFFRNMTIRQGMPAQERNATAGVLMSMAYRSAPVPSLMQGGGSPCTAGNPPPVPRIESATLFTCSVAFDTEPPSLAVKTHCWAVILVVGLLTCATPPNKAWSGRSVRQYNQVEV